MTKDSSWFKTHFRFKTHFIVNSRWASRYHSHIIVIYNNELKIFICHNNKWEWHFFVKLEFVFNQQTKTTYSLSYIDTQFFSFQINHNLYKNIKHILCMIWTRSWRAHGCPWTTSPLKQPLSPGNNVIVLGAPPTNVFTMELPPLLRSW